MKVALIDDNEARAAIVKEGLAGYADQIRRFHADAGLARALAEFEPEVVLMNLGTPHRDALEEMFQVSRALARPIAMFVDQSDESAMASAIDAGVAAYVVDAFSAARVRPVLHLAVRRFAAFSRLQNELHEARSALAEREAVDKAKRLLMKKRCISEPDAYALLRAQAMRSNRRIVDIAEALLTAEDLLR